MTFVQTRPKNPVQALRNYGQSVWLDYLDCHLIGSGEIQTMVESGEVSRISHL